MENLTKKFTKWGLFFLKWGQFFRFSKKGRRGSENTPFQIRTLCLNCSSIHQCHLPSPFPLHLAMQNFSHFQCFDRFSRTYFLLLFKSISYYCSRRIVWPNENLLLIWFLFIIPWCITHFDLKFLYILPHLSLLGIFHNVYVMLIQSFSHIWYTNFHIWSKYLVIIPKETCFLIF